jgi:hypothetical protein
VLHLQAVRSSSRLRSVERETAIGLCRSVVGTHEVYDLRQQPVTDLRCFDGVQLSRVLLKVV